MQHKGIPIEGATMSRSFMDPSYGEHVGTRISFLHFFFFFFLPFTGLDAQWQMLSAVSVSCSGMS